jgi:PAS domain S-box-containing protein
MFAIDSSGEVSMTTDERAARFISHPAGDSRKFLSALADLARQIAGTPAVLVTFFESDRERVGGSIGWDISEIPLDVSLSKLVRDSSSAVVVADTFLDERVANHPLVRGAPGIRFYCGIPFCRGASTVVGTLSLFDRVPRRLEPEQLSALESIAAAIDDSLLARALMVEAGVTETRVDDLRQQLQESEERFRELFDNVDDLIMTIRADGALLHVNSAWLTTFGFSDLNAAPGSIFDTLHPNAADDFRTVFRRVADSGQAEKVETLFYTESGRRLTVEGTLTPKVLDGRTVLLRVIFRDISERKQYEVELGKARDSALESARLKTQFLTNVSHEIRTPMNAIVGMLQLLLDTPLDDEQKDFSNTAISSADELLAMFNNILQMSKIEAGSLSLSASDFDPAETIERVMEVMKIVAAGKNLEIQTTIDPKLPPVLHGDVGALRQVLTNIVSNAVKFTEKGSVAVRVTAENVTKTHHIIRFEVLDSGEGIAEEAIPTLFQAFRQGDASMTRKYGGVGLGLATSKHLIEMLGGVIGVESKLAAGSKFWFTIPFEKRISERLAGSDSRLDLTAARALVLDLSESSRRIIVHSLESSLRSPTEALEMLRRESALGDPFAVAIFDLHIAGMHGIALAEQIKKDPGTASTALVALTSLGEQVDDAMLREFGISVYLAKPVEAQELHDAMIVAMAKEMRPAAPARESETAANDVPLIFGTSILVAEDNLLNQKLTTNQLRKLGYDVEVVATGSEVIDAVSRKSYKAILMDCQMPVMDGYQAAVEIRRREEGKRRVPIIAMTAHALEGDREKCLAAGMDDYLAKPTRQDQLATVLARWVAGGVTSA